MNSALLLLLIGVPLLSSALSVLITSRTFDRFLLLSAPIFGGGPGLRQPVIQDGTSLSRESVGSYVPGLAIALVSDTLTALKLVVASRVAHISCLDLIPTV